MEPRVTSDRTVERPGRRRRWRVLLVLCLIGLFVFGVGVYVVRVNPRRQAIAKLYEDGHGVRVADANRDWIKTCDRIFGYEETQRWLVFLLPIDEVAVSWSTTSDGREMTQDDLAEIIRGLKQVPELKRLSITWDAAGSLPSDRAKPSDSLRAACRAFEHLTQLEGVYCQFAPLDDECLRGLSHSEKLTYLMVQEGPVTGAMFDSPWKSATTLWSIEVDDTEFHHRFLPALRQFTDLHVLSCYNCFDCTCEDCEIEREKRPNLSIDCN